MRHGAVGPCVDETVTDGERIAELLRAELDGRSDGALVRFDVEAPPGDDALERVQDGPGAPAFRVTNADRPVATVAAQPDRALVTATHRADVAFERAREVGLRARPRGTDPPATLVFVESGGAVKRAVDVLVAVADD